MSKAVAGHPDGRNALDAWGACLDARSRGSAVFPLSDSLIYEITRIRRHPQRRALRIVLEELSGFQVVMARHVIARHELEAVLDARIGASIRPLETMPYLDWGVARAFGVRGGFRVMDRERGDVTAEARAAWEGGPDAFDALFRSAEWALCCDVLEGPSSPEQEMELRSKGWDPRAGNDVAENRLRQETEQVERLNGAPEWRRGRLRDVIAAREFLIEVNDVLAAALTDRDRTVADIGIDEGTEIRDLFDAMPSFDVAVTLKAAYHRNGRHRWQINDIHDIDALGSAVPYADVVVTDKAAAHQLNTEGVAARCGTTVISSLSVLVSLL
jgi:hypothetical protein